MSDREQNIRATVHTPYYLASISKTITATALLELVEHKRLNLDRPVNEYLGADKLSSPMWDVSKATVRRVANHTAGLATYDRGCLASDRDCDASVGLAIRRYGVLVWPPGDHFDYSNLDYAILGEVVARASHAGLAATLQRSVFEPLGMADCLLDGSPDRANPTAVRYGSSPPFVRTLPKRSTAPGASSAYCSVHDLALFGMFHLKDHLASQKKILSDRSIDQMQAPSLPAGEEFQYGLSWWVQEDLHGYHGVLAQGGTTDATAYLQLIPSENIAVAMLWNTGTPDGGKVVDQVLATLLPRCRKNLEAAAATAVKPPAQSARASEAPPSMIGAWNGFVETYRGKTPLTLDVSASGLVARLGSDSEAHPADFRFGEGVVWWTMPGSWAWKASRSTWQCGSISAVACWSALRGRSRLRQIQRACGYLTGCNSRESRLGRGSRSRHFKVFVRFPLSALAPPRPFHCKPRVYDGTEIG